MFFILELEPISLHHLFILNIDLVKISSIFEKIIHRRPPRSRRSFYYSADLSLPAPYLV